MLGESLALLGNCGWWQFDGRIGDELRGIAENPWVANCAARDPDKIDFRIVEHPQDIVCGEDVAAAEDGFVGIDLLHFSDSRPVSRAEILLQHGTTVNAHG